MLDILMYKKISVIIPAYMCAETIPVLYNRLNECLLKITDSFEIIFINDNSPLNDWIEIEKIAIKDKNVIGINFSRNFGQHLAITAGIQKAQGEWIIVMDGDLQDKPEEIINLWNKAKEGYDIVYAQRINRKDSFFKKAFSIVFYKILGYLTDTKQDSSIGNFGIYNKIVINAILSMGDSIRYFPAMTRWVGFNSTAIEVEHSEREIGKTSYNIRKLVNLAINVMLAFSEKPLKLTVKLGLSISFLSIIFTIFTFLKYLLNDITVIGWTSVIISIWFFSGLIIFVLGILGLYIGKTFEKVKNRPLYIISKTLN
jgi:dolichol-phosphate mannosyltransferase